jgi:hypothetical protein
MERIRAEMAKYCLHRWLKDANAFMLLQIFYVCWMVFGEKQECDQELRKGECQVSINRMGELKEHVVLTFGTTARLSVRTSLRVMAG